MTTTDKVMHSAPMARPMRAARHRKRSRWPLVVFRVIFTGLLIACILMIFGHSLEIGGASSLRSERVTELVNRVLAKYNTGIQLENAVVRKMAHFLEYTALGFLLTLCMRVYTFRVLGHISWPLFLGLLVAVADEFLQLFTAGRAGQVTDVVLDFSGVLAGVIFGLFILLLGRQFWRELVSADKA